MKPKVTPWVRADEQMPQDEADVWASHFLLPPPTVRLVKGRDVNAWILGGNDTMPSLMWMPATIPEPPTVASPPRSKSGRMGGR